MQPGFEPRSFCHKLSRMHDLSAIKVTQLRKFANYCIWNKCDIGLPCYTGKVSKVVFYENSLDMLLRRYKRETNYVCVCVGGGGNLSTLSNSSIFRWVMIRQHSAMAAARLSTSLLWWVFCCSCKRGDSLTCLASLLFCWRSQSFRKRKRR